MIAASGLVITVVSFLWIQILAPRSVPEYFAAERSIWPRIATLVFISGIFLLLISASIWLLRNAP